MLKQQKLKPVHNFKIFQSTAYLSVLRTKEILIPDYQLQSKKMSTAFIQNIKDDVLTFILKAMGYCLIASFSLCVILHSYLPTHFFHSFKELDKSNNRSEENDKCFKIPNKNYS